MLMPQPNIDTTAPVEATAVFDPPVIRPGGTSTYRVTFNALLDSVQWPEDMIAPEPLVLRSSARAQTLTPTGAALQPRAGFNYRAHAASAGSFTVPRFIVYVYGKSVTVPAATLEVAANPAAPLAPPRLLLLDPANTNPFVGQIVTMRVVLPGVATGVQILHSVKLNGDGFMADQNPVQQRMDIFPQYSSSYSSLVCETTLTPLKPGKLAISVHAFTGGLQSSGPIVIRGNVTIPGGPQPQVLLDSDPITLNVRPLPREKELPGYTGGIGQFKLEPPVLATNLLHVGDPVTLTVNVRGDGNLARLTAPPLPSAPGWQVFAGANDPAPPQLIQARGYVTFNWSLIPTTEATRATPKIPFSYFDPDRAAYVDLSVPPVAVTVKPGTALVAPAAFAETNAPATGAEQEPKLSGLATAPGRSLATLVPAQRTPWFPRLQLVPVILFAALWWWDRRRRFHEAHPEILLRRRARRALRREWAAVRKAAALGDTSRFAACAVNAMRAACAPHYPAEPRALVSSDVVPLLDTSHESYLSQSTEVVRRIFAAADAERFAAQVTGPADVLALRGELDRVLAQLEARL